MPRGDRTGPEGFGPMTGRGAGYCAGYTVPGFMNFGGGRRGVFGGRGRGHRNRFYTDGPYGRGRRFSRGRVFNDGLYAAKISASEELNLFRNEAEAMEADLSALRNRIAELEAETARESSEQKGE